MNVSRVLRADGVLVLTLDEPERRNPLGLAVRQALAAHLAEAEADDAVHAVVLTGAGGHFSAGGDIRDQTERSIAAHRARMGQIRELIGRMVRYAKPLVAAVEGWAVGGGFALALACPTVVAARDARFVAGFTKIGLIPDMGLLATLPARVGPGTARRILLGNAPLEAEQAHGLGIVDSVADPGGAVETAAALALEEASGAPLPRQFVLSYFASVVDAALDYEHGVQPILLNSADAAEGRAAFFEKRPARFKGR
ncbi:enoyl-CoA hydratase/isomerase family protein [Rhodospira trueperi]|uniref:Enoyl-CoA hydratase n=1 Tax=Rhodospira trueperi TaxID=69960 RepID=A0A1G7GGU1_9PROT|nr:enoyl-CoA hydratase/isomerase family protein [Rhodospira trueperi]SDE87350.1 enoyl-CoA hydratase [Rhodospira trueperi]